MATVRKTQTLMHKTIRIANLRSIFPPTSKWPFHMGIIYLNWEYQSKSNKTIARIDLKETTCKFRWMQRASARLDRGCLVRAGKGIRSRCLLEVRMVCSVCICVPHGLSYAFKYTRSYAHGGLGCHRNSGYRAIVTVLLMVSVSFHRRTGCTRASNTNT